MLLAEMVPARTVLSSRMVESEIAEVDQTVTRTKLSRADEWRLDR